MESLPVQADRDLRGVRSLCDAVFFLMKKLIKLSSRDSSIPRVKLLFMTNPEC